MAENPLPGFGPRTPSRRSEPSDDDAPQRTIRSRRALPSGRAVVGGLVVTVAALAVFSAYAGASSEPSRRAVVVTRDVPAGHVLADTDLTTVLVDLPPDTAASTFDDAATVTGSVTLTPIGTRQLVADTSVRIGVPDRPPAHEFSFPVDRERAVDGDLRPGETVDVLATYGSGTDATTSVLARSATVVDAHDAGRGALGTSALVLTVALGSGEQVLDLAHAAQIAQLTVVRSTGVPADASAPDRTERPDRVAVPDVRDGTS